MCGIAAIFGPGEQNPLHLKHMLESIRHRGDEDRFDESKVFGTDAIGMNRLAIVDRDRAFQPTFSFDGRYCAVLNGEIYNYQELKKELLSQNIEFSSDSDTEVLVNGYAVWGVNIVSKLNGMFSFIVYDIQTRDFFVARDPIGIKPLYYAKNNDGVVYFASEAKSLIDLKKNLEIHTFPPASYMKSGMLEKYWRMEQVTNQNMLKDEAVQSLRQLFDEAVKRRVQTDLPVAVYMSGGVDSTSVLEAAQRFHSDVTAVIAGGEASQDRQIAMRFCEERNIKYILIDPPKEDVLFEMVPKIIHMTESFEPNMIRQSAVSFFIAKTAAENGFKVILCGEGADELFAGYPEFKNLTSEDKLKTKIYSFLNDLYRTQLQRVDRTSMFFTTEVRVPFLDKHLVEFALSLPVSMKVKIKENGAFEMKYILRQAVKDKLPDYIWQRQKIVLSEGAGYKGNQRFGGLFYDMASSKISDQQFETCQKTYPEWSIATKEEAYYFKIFCDLGYDKILGAKQRTLVNRADTLDE